MSLSALKMNTNAPLLEVRHLTTRFHTRSGIIHAVEDVSFDIRAGETLGIVGESGSGKSVTCYSMMGLIPKPVGRIVAGSAKLHGVDLLACSEKELRQIRGKRIAMIFQDPMTSLNPYMCIGDQVAEPLVIHEKISWKAARLRAIEELRLVGIPDPEKRASAYPHEFSGGMRQRVMIAMALITRPELLIADEPTTALDVTVQKQVLDLLRQRQEELGTAVILITHDLGVVREYAQRIQVMYAGRIVESALADELIKSPRHAYTRALMASIPALHAKGHTLYTIPGLPPNLRSAARGCSFKPRNTLGNPSLCPENTPVELTEISAQHWVQNCPGCLA